MSIRIIRWGLAFDIFGRGSGVGKKICDNGSGIIFDAPSGNCIIKGESNNYVMDIYLWKGWWTVIVRLYWPNCSRYGTSPMDYFWVECTFDEAESQIFPLLTEDVKRKSIQNGKRKFCIYGTKMPEYCFLISADRSRILSFPPYYPYSGQWNAYNPFRKSKPQLNIQTLDNLYYFDVKS